MSGKSTRTSEERFLAKIDRRANGCWLWTASTQNGYGMMSYEGHKVYAHRVSWLLHFGVIGDDLFVLHRCDNRLCVRPDHLFLGTHQANMADCAAKGRNYLQRHPEIAVGEHNPSAKLTLAQVREIRALVVTESRKSLAVRYGVAYSTVCHIVSGRKWKDSD